MLVHRVAASLAAALLAGAAMAQPASAPPAADFTLPHAYDGYSQPEITQCAGAGAMKRTCQVPAMTAGRYLIVAMDGATSTSDKAAQALAIKLDGRNCAVTNPVAFTGKKALRIACAVQFLTDKPIVISAEYAVQDATADPAGPQLAVRRVPWLGVVEAQPEVLAPPKAPAAKTK